jgi:ABC-2 type transport system permease protein
VSRPAAPWRAMSALAAHELRLTARRGENVLVTLIIPPAVLVFFATSGIVPSTTGPAGITIPPVQVLLPGALALAIIASGLVNLGIATAYDRSYGVLKRLGGSPLPRWGLVGAKIGALLALEVVQVVVLIDVAIGLLGWTAPGGVSPGLFVLAMGLGTLAFAGLGLLLAGTLRAEATLALANGLFLGFLMLGGIVVPIDHLPAVLEPIARALPASALTELFRAALGRGGDPAMPILVLLIWGAVAIGVTVRSFRWE